MRLIRGGSGYQIDARQMREQVDEISGFRTGIMNFHPGLDSRCGENNILGTGRRFCDAVTVPGQKTLNGDALSAAGMILSVIGENEDFEFLSFARPVDGAQFLKFFVESAKDGVNVAPQMLRAVCRMNQSVEVGRLSV